MDSLIYHNGILIQDQEISSWAMDRSYLYGEGLFETMRANQGFIPFLQEHLSRLFRGMEILQMHLDISRAKLEFAIYQTLYRNHLKDAYLRVTLSRQNAKIGVREPNEKVNLTIFASPLPHLSKKLYSEGASAKILEEIKINPDILCQIKTTSYLRNLLSQRMAKDSGVDEALLKNGQENIVEGSSMNFFIFDGNQWITPPLSDGPLPGITRQTVLELCKKNEIPCQEKSITKEHLSTAQEAILTNSIKEILPLTRINGQSIGDGKVGEQTRRLQELYRDEIQYRIETFDSKRWRVEMFS